MRDLLPVAVIVGLAVNLLVRLNYNSLPALPRLAGATLLVLAVAEAALGVSLRARIQRRPGTRPVEPLAAARAVALAKASSLAGSIVLGGWLGVLGYVLPQRENLAASGDTASAAVGGVSAAALVAAGLWLEYCCRTPRDDSDPSGPSRRGSGGHD